MKGKVRPVDRCGVVVVAQRKDGRYAVLGSRLDWEEDRTYGVYKTLAAATYRKLQVMKSSMHRKGVVV